MLGYALTAGVIAGGSKASIALFHDFLRVQSTILKEKKKQQAAGQQPNPQAEPEAEAAP